MNASYADRLKRYVGFDAGDVARLRELRPHVQSVIPHVVDRFYSVLLSEPDARAVFTGGEEQVEAQRKVFKTWISELFNGTYEADYFTERLRIGAAHVRHGVPQHYMVTGIEIVWQEFEHRLRNVGIQNIEEKLQSLHKLLTLELAFMLETFKEQYSEIVRQTERTAVEEKLTRAEHLAEIGQLAATLAHEIKNPLAGISGAIQVIRDAMESDDVHRPVINEILVQIKRLDETVKDLLQYARPSPPRRTEFSLRDVVAGLLTVLRQGSARSRIQFDLTGSGADTIIHADKGQIEQLVMNLLINAIHATEVDGDVRISIEPAGDRVRIVVADTGTGMPEGVPGQAFEPFFTTKARGTGLGLSLCRRITDAHSGTIRLESQWGEGTMVTAELPVRSTQPTSEESP